eukprot:scaffold823_cov219-Amphora_coffeaeformis.AAC.37
MEGFPNRLGSRAASRIVSRVDCLNIKVLLVIEDGVLVGTFAALVKVKQDVEKDRITVKRLHGALNKQVIRVTANVRTTEDQPHEGSSFSRNGRIDAVKMDPLPSSTRPTLNESKVNCLCRISFLDFSPNASDAATAQSIRVAIVSCDSTWPVNRKQKNEREFRHEITRKTENVKRTIDLAAMTTTDEGAPGECPNSPKISYSISWNEGSPSAFQVTTIMRVESSSGLETAGARATCTMA